jgi:choline monooxygenase
MRSFTLASWLYTDADVFEAEKASIFERSWQCVAHIEELRAVGDVLATGILDHEIVVARGRDGGLRAFRNLCPAGPHRLVDGPGGALACPRHGLEFDDAGRAGDRALEALRLEVFANIVFVNLDPTTAPLADQAGDLAAEIDGYAPDLDRLTHAHRLTYDIAANWKTVIDNFLECYHCPVAHRAFVGLIDMASYNIVPHGIWSSHHAAAGSGANDAFNVAAAAEVTVHAVWWLWPNTAFLRYPGSPNMMVWRFIPTGPETTHEIFDFYFLEPEPDAAQREAIAYIDEVLQPEDIEIVEAVQRGLHSRGYSEGRIIADGTTSGLGEHGIHHFHGLVLDALEG